MAGGVDDDLGAEVGVGGVEHAHLWVVLGDKPAAVGIELDHGEVAGFEPSKCQHAEADGTGTDDEHVVSRSQGGTVHGMAADAEGLDQGELVKGEGSGGVQLVGGQKQAFAQAAVAMHAEHLEGFAAIGFALQAGVAGAAVQVGLHAASIPRGHVADLAADGDDFDTELMAEDAWVVDEGHFTQVTAEVGAADADGANGDQRLAGAGCGGLGEVDEFECFGAGETEGAHERRREKVKGVWRVSATGSILRVMGWDDQ